MKQDTNEIPTPLPRIHIVKFQDNTMLFFHYNLQGRKS